MDLLWPAFLVLLAIIPLLIVAYVWILRRRRRFTVRYSSLALVREGQPRTSRWRRHLPFALFLIALSSLVIAMGRPVTIASVPSGQTTVVFLIDVSGSMCQNDVLPTRLGAAQNAAIAFVQKQKSTTQIGVVAFSSTAELVQAPTNDSTALQAAIESLAVGRRTAIGSGILKAIDAIAEVDPAVAPSVYDSSKVEPTPVPRGAYAPDIIVLLTDGQSNTGPSPIDAAQQAVDRGVRIYTIGYGTETGSTSFRGCGTRGGGGGGFGGGFGGFGGGFGGGGGGGFRRGIDDVTLKQVAAMTGGTYHAAASASELQSVFDNLPTYLITKHEVTEVSVAFAALGVLLAAAAVGLGLMWQPLP
jgi:Ca-activated chloride channel family protein